MRKRDRKFLSVLCADLMTRFPGVTAAFEGFVSPCLGGHVDGYLDVEIFNVPDGDRESILSFAEAQAQSYCAGGGGVTAFGIWSPDETATHFAEDVEAVRARWSPVVDQVSLCTLSASHATYYVPAVLCDADSSVAPGAAWEPQTSDCTLSETPFRVAA